MSGGKQARAPARHPGFPLWGQGGTEGAGCRIHSLLPAARQGAASLQKRRRRRAERCARARGKAGEGRGTGLHAGSRCAAGPGKRPPAYAGASPVQARCKPLLVCSGAEPPAAVAKSKENVKHQSCSHAAGFVHPRSADVRVPEAWHLHAAHGRPRAQVNESQPASEDSGRFSARLARLALNPGTRGREPPSSLGEVSIRRCTEV